MQSYNHTKLILYHLSYFISVMGIWIINILFRHKSIMCILFISIHSFEVSYLFLILTGDPLHSRAACTQPCNVNTHSRAHCSPGARLCEQWEHGCVNNGTRLCASARLCRGSPVILRWLRWLISFRMDGMVLSIRNIEILITCIGCWSFNLNVWNIMDSARGVLNLTTVDRQ